MRLTGWSIGLALALAAFASAEDLTVTVTNYITPLCFANAIKSLDNGEDVKLGIPIVLIWGTESQSTETAKPVAPEVTVTDYITEYWTTIVPCTITGYATKTETGTTCVDQKCQKVVSTVVLPVTYVTSTKTVVTTTSTLTTCIGTSTTGKTTTGGKPQTTAASVYSGVQKCTKCHVVTLVLSYLTTETSVIYSASVTPEVTILLRLMESVATTGPNPLYTETPVTTGSTITINSDWDLSSVLAPSTTSSTGASKATGGNSGNTSAGKSAGNTSSKAPETSPSSLVMIVSGSSTSHFSGYSNSTESGVLSSSSPLEVSSTEHQSSGKSSSTLSSSSSLASSSITSSSVPSSSLSSATTATDFTLRSTPTCHFEEDLFAPIDTTNPSTYFAAGELPLTLPDYVTNSGPYQTNKFYGNLMLDNQDQMAWTYPYGFFWDRLLKYGFAVQHTDISTRLFGPTNSNGAASYFYNQILLGELIFSATSINAVNNVMAISDMTEMSANVRLSAAAQSSNYIQFPLVKGMGFATAVYHGSLIVRISSTYAITGLTQETVIPSSSVLQKYRVTLNNGMQWLLYVTKPLTALFSLSLSGSDIVASGAVDGLIIQAAPAPSSSALENYYYEAAGKYVTTAEVTGAVECSAVAYSFDYTSTGTNIAGLPLVFALPHHLETLTATTLGTYTGIQLDSTTKGKMSAFLTSSLQFAETINTNIQFYPWREDFGTAVKYTPSQLEAIREAAVDELTGVDVAATIKLQSSMYYMGKLADKYAYIMLVLHDVLQDEELAQQVADSLKTFFADLSLNNIDYPLMHDTRYGGVTSTANNGGDTSAEFGAGYYNDHHFHYGYHIHAAALLGFIDKKLGGTWAQDNKGWVNALVRDVANPSVSDTYFPVLRYFDWYHGHLYAKGLFSSGDGKDEESSSEDYNFSYGMKLWGNVIGDGAMEARGDLMLKIQSRALNLYFLYLNGNTVEPSNFIANRVSGIYYENKIDHTTYFGTNTEYIHGIHMLPITPASSLIRGQTFVSQEWTSILSLIVGGLTSGWAGILRLNEALYDATTSYSYFSSPLFSMSYLDGGQSLTWSLAFSAAIANGPVA